MQTEESPRRIGALTAIREGAPTCAIRSIRRVDAIEKRLHAIDRRLERIGNLLTIAAAA